MQKVDPCKMDELMIFPALDIKVGVHYLFMHTNKFDFA
jgi:hypothetical protein